MELGHKKTRKALRRLIDLAMFLVLCLLIFYLGARGEVLYDRTHPHVRLCSPTTLFRDGAEYLCIPRDSYFHGVIFIVSSERGFFLTNERVHAVSVEVEDLFPEDDFLVVVSPLSRGSRILRAVQEPFPDGEVVIVLGVSSAY